MNIEFNKIIMKGITGFISDSNTTQKQDIKPFVSIIYFVMKGKLECEDLDLVGKNYYRVEVSSNGQEFGFILNAYYPIAAISKKIGEDYIFLSEIEIEEKFRLFTEFNYTILSKEILEKDINRDDLNDLTDFEIKQYEYWKPRTLSDLIFNNWD